MGDQVSWEDEEDIDPKVSVIDVVKHWVSWVKHATTAIFPPVWGMEEKHPGHGEGPQAIKRLERIGSAFEYIN